jgi:hypothetical protein
VAAENPDTTVHFEIAGERYEYPDPFDLTLDEWAVVYDISGVALEDVAPQQNKKLERERIKKLRHPNTLKGLAVVGYLRAKPDEDPEDAKDLIGSARMVGLLESMAPDEDAEDPTQASPTPIEDGSTRSEDDSSEDSSSDSVRSSETPDDEPVATGIGG